MGVKLQERQVNYKNKYIYMPPPTHTLLEESKREKSFKEFLLLYLCIKLKTLLFFKKIIIFYLKPL